jgi:hypothetical protein
VRPVTTDQGPVSRLGRSEIFRTQMRLSTEFPALTPRHIVVAVGNARQILEWAADVPRINDVEDLARQCLQFRAAIAF